METIYPAEGILNRITDVAEARDTLGLGNTSGALPVANGGTEATNAQDARTNLGLGAVGTYYAANGNHASFPASSTPQEIASLTLPAGKYVVTGYISVAGTTNGGGTSRIVEARIYAEGADYYAQRVFSNNAGAVTQITLTGILNLGPEQTIRFRVFSTTAVSGSSDYKFHAVRIV